jgi:tRNA A37 methylthiotransferase MiaB
MQWILTCENGKQIDMSSDILKQMERKITRQDVLERIEFYKSTNKK